LQQQDSVQTNTESVQCISISYRIMSLGPINNSLSVSPALKLTIGGPLWPLVYHAPLWKHGISKIMGSQPWIFVVTWRHRSRNHSTRGEPFSMGGPL